MWWKYAKLVLVRRYSYSMHWPIYRPSADQLNCLHVCTLVKIHSTGYEWRAMSEFLSQNLKRKHLSTSSSLSPSFSHIEKKINFTTNSSTSNTSSMADHSESLGDPGILSQSLQSKIAMINQGKLHVPSTGLPSGPPPSFGFLGVGTGAGAPLTSTPAPTVGNQDQPGISDTDVLRIALTVKSLLSADLDKMVNEKVASLTSCMEVLSDENKKLRLQLDELEMYSRRSLVRIFGVAETKTDTDAAVMEIANKIEVKLTCYLLPNVEVLF